MRAAPTLLPLFEQPPVLAWSGMPKDAEEARETKMLLINLKVACANNSDLSDAAIARVLRSLADENEG